MKIYFTAACENVSDGLRKGYAGIVKHIESLGHQVAADHILGDSAKVFLESSDEDEEFLALARRMLVSKNQCDLIIVEATQSSVSVGQELSYALKMNKPVIVLYKKSASKPRLLRGLNTDSLYLVSYTDKTVKELLHEYIEYSKDMADTRFNFFISPQIGNYLNWIAKELRSPRAVFLRDLIEKSMEEDGEYQDSQE